MTVKALIGLVVGLGVVLVSATGGLAQEPARDVMVITYTNGASQVVRLNYPSCDIQTIEFTSEMGITSGAEGSTYTDSQGNQIFVPCGELAFADQVVEYRIGDPAPVHEIDRVPESSLGPPDYQPETDTGEVTLGCGGSIVLEFTRAALVDIEGPDLYVFEVGPAVEPTQLEISRDGSNWINVGEISGGKASVDIYGFGNPGDQFRYVRLTDLKSACVSTEWPGADIDAVAAIGCTLTR